MTTKQDLPATENDSVAGKSRFMLYENKHLKVFVERKNTSWESDCYVSVGGTKKKLTFGNEYLDSGTAEFSVFAYEKYLFVVGDIKPNSNGWTNRFLLYKMKRKDLKPIFIDVGAAIDFRKDEMVMARARLTNPDAGSTAEERWLMHDVHYDTGGRLIKEDRQEYDYQEMTERYGDNLINAENKTDSDQDDKPKGTNEDTEENTLDNWMQSCLWAEWECDQGRITVLYPAFMEMNKERMKGNHDCLNAEWGRLNFRFMRYRDKTSVKVKYEALKSGATTSSVGEGHFLLAGKIYDDMRFFEKHLKTENHWCYLRVEFPVSMTAAIDPLLQYVKDYQLAETIMR